jgi:translation elongation factor EF-G
VLYDGSYHPVDSSEMAFKMATIQAFKKGFMEAHPVLLEPIASLKVTVPDSYTGDVMGDLNKRRGRVLGMNPLPGGKQVVEAEIPMSSLFGYCTDLRSMTGGRGDYAYEFVRYEQAPSDVQEKEVAARAAKVAENNIEEYIEKYGSNTSIFKVSYVIKNGVKLRGVTLSVWSSSSGFHSVYFIPYAKGEYYGEANKGIEFAALVSVGIAATITIASAIVVFKKRK